MYPSAGAVLRSLWIQPARTAAARLGRVSLHGARLPLALILALAPTLRFTARGFPCLTLALDLSLTLTPALPLTLTPILPLTLGARLPRAARQPDACAAGDQPNPNLKLNPSPYNPQPKASPNLNLNPNPNPNPTPNLQMAHKRFREYNLASTPAERSGQGHNVRVLKLTLSLSLP